MEQNYADATDIRLLELLQTDASLSNQSLAERVHISPPTCLRRVKRLREAGLIEREIAVLSPDKLAAVLGYGLTALVEISLDRQGAEWLEAFEARVMPDDAVQQCYQVSPGPDFMLVVHVADMRAYQALAQRLFTSDANVRNVKAFFSIKRAKFQPKVLLSQ
ncbi:Lrp/AsnC family transcriptional regulator [soil metagenome]